MDAKELIQEIIEKEGVTPYRIAKDLKVEPSTVYKWQDGGKKPNGEHMVGLLRRAGRLAAMVMLGAFVSQVAAPQDAVASPLQAEKALIIKRLCIM